MRRLRRDVEIVQKEFSDFRRSREDGSYGMGPALKGLEDLIVDRLEKECIEICPSCSAQQGHHYEGCEREKT